MERNVSFAKEVRALAIPVALQCMLQSSFSIIDQIMIGQLGSVSIAAIGLAGKFSSIYSFVVAAIGTVAGIMISQYIGSHDKDEADKSLSVNLLVSVAVSVLFMLLCIIFPSNIMGIYSTEQDTVATSAEYLRIVSLTFLPLAVTTCLSTMLRCVEKAMIPLYASIAAALFNTGLDYVLIFGKLGFPAMGVNGAAIATVISAFVNMAVVSVGFFCVLRRRKTKYRFSIHLKKMSVRQYLAILFPILITEVLWSIGENVYASIYGHLGTDNCAAMTLTTPIQGLMIGALSGLSQTAGILIGKKLGERDYDTAYKNSKKLMLYGLVGSLIMSALLVVLRFPYVGIYNVDDSVRTVGNQLLLVFAIMAPIKVLNMILGGGIIRSGGKTKIVMLIDTIGTWGFGVPLGFLSAFCFNLPITYVYFILSLEELVRLIISLVVFRKRVWIKTLG